MVSNVNRKISTIFKFVIACLILLEGSIATSEVVRLIDVIRMGTYEFYPDVLSAVPHRDPRTTLTGLKASNGELIYANGDPSHVFDFNNNSQWLSQSWKNGNSSNTGAFLTIATSINVEGIVKTSNLQVDVYFNLKTPDLWDRTKRPHGSYKLERPSIELVLVCKTISPIDKREKRIIDYSENLGRWHVNKKITESIQFEPNECIGGYVNVYFMIHNMQDFHFKKMVIDGFERK